MVDSTTFKISTTTAAALITLKPGAMREMHWHPNADEWQYWIKGEGRMGVFNAGPNVQTQDFRAGDIGYIPRNQGHYFQNTGTTDLQVLDSVQGPRVPRGVAFGVAGAHAAGAGGTTFQHRSVGAGTVPAERSRHPAGVTSGRPDPGTSFVHARITLAVA